MELTRSINSNEFYKILSDFRRENYEEMKEFANMIKDLKENLKIGEKYSNYRYTKFCSHLENGNNRNNIEGYNSLFSYYDFLKLNKSSCEKLADDEITIQYKQLKNKLYSMRLMENKTASKCFVLEFSENDIKKCLKKKFSKVKNNLTNDIMKYYISLEQTKIHNYI